MAQDIRQIIQRLEREVWKEGRVELMDELYADNFTWRTPLPGYDPNISGYRKFVRDSSNAFDVANISTEQVIVDDNFGAYIWKVSGRHVGSLLGFEATNRQFEYSGVTVIRLENGMIIEEWGYPDTFGLMMQLGLMPQGQLVGAQR